MSLLLGAGLLLALSGLASASGEGGHGAHLNWADFFTRTLVFAVLVGLIVKLTRKPIAGFFSSRKEQIQKLLAELEVKIKEAEEKSSEYAAKLAALDAEASKIMAEYVAEGEAEKQRIIDSAKRQADYIREQAQIAIQQEIKAARESLQGEIADLSVAAAEELLRKSIAGDDQERLVREFMTRVAEAK
ncbi:MAG: F0F1 ATP synthase subunit B [Deltaproteobacteria bacterium]|nr:F0F1 ATP synthase subunit B [Deltaproteobacteria bacterium]